jgi:integrase
MPRQKHVPAYRLHKQSGQAIVTLTDGPGTRRDILLGKHDTPESWAEYARVLAEWEASGRRLSGKRLVGGLSVNELILAYWHFAEGYYLKNGEPTSQQARIRLALKPVRELYGHTIAGDFGPKALKAVSERMVACGWTRGYVNSSVGCVKRMFKWAVAEEWVPAATYHGLQAVVGLKKGRSAAPDTRPVRPVDAAHIEAVLPELSSTVRAMVLVQRWTGMRPCEVIAMRPCDLDRTRTDTWVYRPESHKTEHHGVERVIFLGPRAQAALTPFLEDRHPGAYLFCPGEAAAEFLRRSGRLVRYRRRRAPGKCYTTASYDWAIAKACVRAGVPHWTPNQLRHSKATEIRREVGLDAARAVLGHRSPAVTETYAELDQAKAAEVMERLG